MKKIFFNFSFLAASMLSLGMASCQNEDIAAPSVDTNDEGVLVHAVANASVDNSPESRTNKLEGEDGLMFSWGENDKIVVLSEDGQDNLGVMTITDGYNTPNGSFDGTLRVRTKDKKVNIYYLGKEKTENANLANIMIDENFKIHSQDGKNESITAYDIMYSQADVIRKEDGSVSLNLKLKSVLSFAHYYIHFPEGVNPTNEKVTVKGDNIFNEFTLKLADATLSDKKVGEIIINPKWSTGESNEGDFYMAVVPNSGSTTNMEITIGEKIYKADVNANYNPNKIYCGGTAHGKDIYFSEDGSWTLTYMNGDAEFYTDSKTNYGPSCDFTITDKVPTKDAEAGAAPYVFEGWAETADGPVVYTNGDQLTLDRPETTKTLYAVYTQDNTQQTFTLTGIHVGRTLDNTVKTVTGTWPTTVNANILGAASDDDYEFKGYYSDAACTNQITTVTFNYDTKAINVYCKWERVIYSLEIICDNNGGKWVTEDNTNWSRDTSLPYSYKDLSNFEKPVRTGYTFKGWSLTPNGNLITEVPFVASDDSDGDHKISKTIYAIWRDNNVTTSGNVTIEDAIGTGY